MDIVDVQTVWQCSISNVSTSTDGGESWQAVESDSGTNCAVSFVDAETGWTFWGGKLSATSDGGATWDEVTLPAGVGTISALSLRTATSGYLMTPEGVLHSTDDGGESWSSQDIIGEGDYGEMILLPSDQPTAAIRFSDADHGVIVMSMAGGGDSKVVALRTADGGKTWDEELVPAEIGVAYLSRDGAYVTVTSFLTGGAFTVSRYTGE